MIMIPTAIRKGVLFRVSVVIEDLGFLIAQDILDYELGLYNVTHVDDWSANLAI